MRSAPHGKIYSCPSIFWEGGRWTVRDELDRYVMVSNVFRAIAEVIGAAPSGREGRSGKQCVDRG